MVDNYGDMVDKSLPVSYTVGSVVRGRVVQINEEGIFVDIGTKTEARLDYGKVVTDDIPEINAGSDIEAKIIGYKDGIYHLSKKALDYERGWALLEKDFKNQNTIKVRITRKVANGFMAEAYRVATGFIHEKNFTEEPKSNDMTEVVIAEFDSKKKKVVFSRRPLIIAEKKKKIEQEYENIQIGMEVEGKVEKLSAFGAFVKITDHVVGLLHISEMSHDHIKAPASVCKVGDKIKVRIISVDRENGRVGLSRKDTYSDPILEIVEGEDYEGVVENMTEFGAFVRLPNGVVGLVHISEISYARFEKVQDVLRTGLKTRVKVLSVNLRDRRVSLSIKQLDKDPWDAVHEKYAVGERLDVTVKEINNGGMVVSIDDAYEGFIPISEISHERIEHPSKLHSVGDVVKAQVINIDGQRRKIKLSIRQTLDRFAEDGVQDVRVSTEDSRPTAVAMTLGDLLSKSGFTASSVEESTDEMPPEEQEAKPEKKRKHKEAESSDSVESAFADHDETAVSAPEEDSAEIVTDEIADEIQNEEPSSDESPPDVVSEMAESEDVKVDETDIGGEILEHPSADDENGASVGDPEESSPDIELSAADEEKPLTTEEPSNDSDAEESLKGD